MAGDWLKFDLTLPDKPEVILMAQALTLSRDDICGKVMRFWGWWSNHSDGAAMPTTVLPLIDDLIGCQGFRAAMESVRWLVVESDRVWLPNFDRHCSTTAKQRALSNERKRRSRKAAEKDRGSREEVPQEAGRQPVGPAAKEAVREAVDREAARKGGRSTTFLPPGVSECVTYAKHKQIAETIAREFHLHYQAQGWVMGNGQRMQSWHAALQKFAAQRATHSTAAKFGGVRKRVADDPAENPTHGLSDLISKNGL